MAPRDLQVDVLVNARADTKRAQAEIGSFALRMRRDIEKAVRALPDIKIGADSTDAEVEIAAIRADLKELSKLRPNVDIDPTLANARIADLSARLEKLNRESGDVVVKADTAEALKALQNVRTAMRAVDGLHATAEVDVKTDKAERGISRVRSGLSDLAKVARSSAIAAGIGGILGAGAAGVGGALAGVGSLALQFGVAKAAISGSKAALDAYDKALADGKGDLSEYRAELAKMTPQQRAFTEAVVAAKGPLGDLQKTAGRSFLPGLTDGLKGALTLFPVLDGAVARTGGIMGDTARKLGDLFRTDKFKADLDGFLRSTEPVTRAIGDTFVQLTGKLIEFGAKMRPAADGLASFIRSAGDGISGFLDQLAPHADSFKRIFESLGRIVAQLLPLIGRVAGSLADSLGPVLESLAGFLERNSGLIASLAPHVGTIVLALQGLRAARGIAEILSPIATGIAAVVRSSSGSEAVGTFGSKLAGLKGAGAIAIGVAALATAIDQVNINSAGGAGNLDGIARNLHDATKTLGPIVSGQVGFNQIIDQARAAARGVENAFNGVKLTPLRMDLNVDEARGQKDRLIAEINSAAPEVNINGNTTGAGFAYQEILREIAAGKAEIIIDGEPVPAQEALARVKSIIDTSVGTVSIDGKNEGASTALSQVIGQVNAARPTIVIAGDANPATGAITQAVNLGNGSKATMTFGADAKEANGQITRTVTFADGTKGTMTYDANRTPADGKINATVTYANGQRAQLQIGANTGPAQGAINSFITQNNGRRINILVTSTGSGGIASAGRLARGGIVKPMAAGGTLRMASGGVAGPRYRPMLGNYAQVVPRGTQRIIGDNMLSAESYIPINGSARSRKILGSTAKAMGYTVGQQTRTPVTTQGGPAWTGGAGMDLSPLIRAMNANTGQMRMLRGDVDTSGGFASVVNRLDRLTAVVAGQGGGGSRAASSALANRSIGELGAF